MLSTLYDAADKPTALVGGKAKALGQLTAFGAPVPPGFVVTPNTDLEAWQSQILAAFDALGATHVVVRSSAAGEDSESQSWAGQFDSYLYVARSQLIERIQDCRRSGASERAQAYDPAESAMAVAVVVQAMVASDVAGVLFTANPVTGNLDQIMIEAVYGLGEQLVQGLSTPDNYILNKSGHLVSQTIATKSTQLVGTAKGVEELFVASDRRYKPALAEAQLAELTKLATNLESKFGHPLDIEWAYAKGKLYILQARPITTL